MVTIQLFTEVTESHSGNVGSFNITGGNTKTDTHTYPYAHFLIVSKRNTGRINQREKHWKEEGENEKQKEEWK